MPTPQNEINSEIFNRLKSQTEIEYGPVPLTVVTHHHEESL